MKTTQLKYLILATLITYLFMGCAGEERLSSLNSLESTKHEKVEHATAEEIAPVPHYGQHPEAMEEFLSTVPIGSEIYLEEKKDGAWYLKIEKTFTTTNNSEEEQPPAIVPVYAESILI